VNAIELNQVSKSFGGRAAVDRLSFAVEAGTIVGFLGPNGAGKTTTLRMVLGLVTPSEGTATINGLPYRALNAPTRVVGAMLEASSAYEGRTARNHLRIQALASVIGAQRIDEVLELVGLVAAADRRIGEFSLGMRQRLGLATALLCEPEILILDEPANGLDPEGVHWLRQLLRGLADEGRTVLISSHILAEVAQTVDSVVILDRGRLVTQSTLAELTANTSTVVQIRTSMADELSAALIESGATSKLVAPDRVEVAGSTPEQIGLLAAKLGVPIFETTTETPDLEDVFLRLTSDVAPKGRTE
jgi:ABC-2 type transport system ATP-binding protein